MKRLSLYFFFFGLFFLSAPVGAQEIPVFSLWGGVTRGRLPSGIEYYLLPGLSSKGYADFALVQLEAPDSSVLRASLRDLPHFRGREPYRFLADAGVGYRRDGYLRRSGDAAVFEFFNVPVYRTEVADSVYLMLLDIAAKSDGSQALMVCGDIDVDATRRTLSLLSLMTPPAPRISTRPALPAYQPLPYECHVIDRGATTALRWEFRFPRLSEKQMNTPLPFVLRLYTSCLSELLDARIRTAFSEAGIPLAELTFRYRDSSDSPLFECYSIGLRTLPGDAQRAEVLMAGVLSALCENGAGVQEFRHASSCVFFSQSLHGASGAAAVRSLHRLVNHYLYGSTLTSPGEVEKFFARRKMSPNQLAGLFNGFVRELLSPVLDGGEDRQVYLWNAPDSSSLVLPVARVRLISDRPAPGGGRRWSFSNGMKVVYRPQKGGGHFRYAVSLHGGYNHVRHLREGEGAFIGDLWALEGISGMRRGEMAALLRGEGIRMDAQVSLEDFRLEGDAPSGKYPLLFKALLAMGTRLERDGSALGYFAACEALSERCGRSVDERLDSIAIAPYLYTSLRDASHLSQDLQERAHRYFQSRFQAVNDGLIVLTGDLDEAALKKFLCRHLGNFTTAFRRERRASMTVPLRSGSLSFTVPADRREGQSVHVAMYGRLVLSRKNYMTFQLAQVALEKELVRSLADKGLYATVDERMDLLPEEWVCLRVHCRPCHPSGLPEGVAPDGAGEAALALRAAVDRLREGSIAQKDLEAWKAALVRRVETLSQDPAFYLSATLFREVSGKDFLSDYAAVIKSIRAEDLQSVLTTLYDGCRIEYNEL